MYSMGPGTLFVIFGKCKFDQNYHFMNLLIYVVLILGTHHLVIGLLSLVNIYSIVLHIVSKSLKYSL